MLSSMKLVFLHGSPAVGKLTVAKALLSMAAVAVRDERGRLTLKGTVGPTLPQIEPAWHENLAVE